MIDDLDTTARILLMGPPCPALASGLETAGWHVTAAPDEMGALSLVRNQPFDIALLHLSVDDMVGEDLPNVLRRVCPASYLPVMILVDGPAQEQRCRFLQSGADDVVCLSTGRAEILARAAALLRVKRLHDQLAASHDALQQALTRERKLLAKLRHDNQQLQRLAATDALTHLQNLRSFQDILAHQFRTAKRYGRRLSLLGLDVDHFKRVNDVHGHPSGDYVLKELASILTSSVRESDVVCRTGGEEFTVILPEADASQAEAFAERIRAVTEQREFLVHGRSIHATVSLGVATFPTDVEITEPDLLIYFADQALLFAKSTGRNRVIPIRTLAPDHRAGLRAQFFATRDSSPVPSDAPALSDPAERTSS